jgi:23S rRNA (guanosine2251-2'-O)-methyltransferase
VDAFTAELPLPAVLVLGNEDKGVRPGVAGRCSLTWPSPSPGLRLLNVAQAGAILVALHAGRKGTGNAGGLPPVRTS